MSNSAERRPAMPGPASYYAADQRVIRGIAEAYTPYERLTDAALVVDHGRFAWVGAEEELPTEYHGWPSVDLRGRAVIPGLVDAHTHLVWAGNRVHEYVQRSHGATYEEILAAGGGIHATVRATSAMSEAGLLVLARRRAGRFLRGGVTALEVKSGYGRTTEDELKMLRVARRLGEDGPQRITTTLLAHVPDPDLGSAKHVERIVSETIPEAARLGLADAVDVFCDRGAFTLAEARAILEAAREHGLPIKAHAEQLHATGAARLVAELGGLSADHLERSGEVDWRALARAGTVATLVPVPALLLGAPLPRAEALRAAGVTVAIASDHNPGSSPLYGLLPALQLAIATAGFTVEEALAAGTAHAAKALGRPDWGVLQAGAMADYLVVDGADALLPLYSWGHPALAEMVIGGRVVWRQDG